MGNRGNGVRDGNAVQGRDGHRSWRGDRSAGQRRGRYGGVAQQMDRPWGRLATSRRAPACGLTSRAAPPATRHDQCVSRNLPSFVESVRQVVRDLMRGEVVSYGEVARRAGYPRAARAVGNVLASTIGLPWWRVIRANGELAAASREEQIRRLRREGVQTQNGRVKGIFSSGNPVITHQR